MANGNDGQVNIPNEAKPLEHLTSNEYKLVNEGMNNCPAKGVFIHTEKAWVRVFTDANGNLQSSSGKK